ncbi:MAG: hypothetical protein H6R26_270 [Proteobacteria bacterium]|nr:hypothetical protein [Pseudomonadota bacterium]
MNEPREGTLLHRRLAVPNIRTGMIWTRNGPDPTALGAVPGCCEAVA